MKSIIFDLQRFADTNFNVNTTTGNADPYAGTTEQNGNMAVEMKTFYQTALLENARPELFYMQFAKKQALPKNHGRTVEFRKFATLPNATALTEGVVPDGKSVSFEHITDSIAQYGMYAAGGSRGESGCHEDAAWRREISVKRRRGSGTSSPFLHVRGEIR